MVLKEISYIIVILSLSLSLCVVCPAAMSFINPPTDTTPIFSDDEGEGTDIKGEGQSNHPEAECASGVSSKRALMTVTVLCYINLLNYMDRFTVAGIYCSTF